VTKALGRRLGLVWIWNFGTASSLVFLIDLWPSCFRGHGFIKFLVVNLRRVDCACSFFTGVDTSWAEEKMKKIGVIGLGNMGFHMARNLVEKSGRAVVCFDRSSEALAKINGEAGAETARSPAEVAEQCDTIVSMLPGNDSVRAVYLGADGILQTLGNGSLCIDSSTIDPNVARVVAKEFGIKGSAFIDAPVSGGVGGAEKGTLTFMVGGTKEEFERATPVLKFMGANVAHCGPIGTGLVAKLCNNQILAATMLAVSESMNLGIKMGMDRKALAAILNTSTARCWSSDTYNPVPGVMEGVPSSRDYEGGFASALMLKDLGLAQDAAKATGVDVPMGKRALALYQEICSGKKGLANKDFSVAFKFLEELTSDR